MYTPACTALYLSEQGKTNSKKPRRVFRGQKGKFKRLCVSNKSRCIWCGCYGMDGCFFFVSKVITNKTLFVEANIGFWDIWRTYNALEVKLDTLCLFTRSTSSKDSFCCKFIRAQTNPFANIEAKYDALRLYKGRLQICMAFSEILTNICEHRSTIWRFEAIYRSTSNFYDFFP